VTTLDYLNQWAADGRLSAPQHRLLTSLVQRERISVFIELNALLYLAVLFFAGGLAWTARVYSAQWGDAAILIPATTLVVGCLGYCFVRGQPFARTHVGTSGLAFDYVLYLACLVFAVELGYVEYRFQLLRDRWDYYLLASAVAYFLLAYRFDNRFVLSLAVATLGGWFGVRLARLDLFVADTLRLYALAYGSTVAALGAGLHRAALKPHFVDTYMHLSANVVLAALVSGVIDSRSGSLWLIALLIASAAAVVGGVRARRFAFVVYGVGYGYVGISHELLRNISGDQATLSYLVVSASITIAGLVILSRRIGRTV
jgi:hypothetical protein